MAVRYVLAAIVGGVFAHPGGLKCGDERFVVGNVAQCMTLDIQDQPEHPGLRFETDTTNISSNGEVVLQVKVESPGPYDNSTGQDPYGIYFAVLANASDSSDHGSFTEVPDSVAQKDNVTCPHMVFSSSDDCWVDGASLTWTAGPNTCGDVSFTIIWGNGPGDTAKAPEDPFLSRAMLTVTGAPCAATTTTASPTTTAAVPKTTTTSPVPGHMTDVLIGFAKGLLNDAVDNFAKCKYDGAAADTMFTNVLADLNAGNVLKACNDLSSALEQISLAMVDCQAVAMELRELAASLKAARPSEVEANIKAHITEIMEAAAEASSCKDSNDWVGVGEHFGEAVRLVLPLSTTLVSTTSSVHSTTLSPATTSTSVTTSGTSTSATSITSTVSPSTSSTTAQAASTWVCGVCAHVYDATQDGAGVAFEDLPDSWVCPVCAQPKAVYEKQVQDMMLV